VLKIEQPHLVPAVSTQYFTYILECADGSYYTGTTDDVERRLKTHNDGLGAKYTRSHLPVKLVAFWSFASRSLALKEEWRIKQLTRKQKQLLIAAYTSA
jgi:putative endonuclease